MLSLDEFEQLLVEKDKIPVDRAVIKVTCDSCYKPFKLTEVVLDANKTPVHLVCNNPVVVAKPGYTQYSLTQIPLNFSPSLPCSHRMAYRRGKETFSRCASCNAVLNYDPCAKCGGKTREVQLFTSTVKHCDNCEDEKTDPGFKPAVSGEPVDEFGFDLIDFVDDPFKK